MLDITEMTGQKYHIEYGTLKSNVMKISRNRNKPKFILGNIEIEYNNNYKYLGFMQITTNNMKDNLQTVKGKLEAVHQRILTLSGNTTLKI